jgi:hypothetical protein
MSTEAPPQTWTRTAKFLGLPLLVFVLLQADNDFPFVRFSNAFANVAFGTLSFLLPFLAAFFAFVVPKRWLTSVLVVVFLLPILCFSAAGLFFEGLMAGDIWRTGLNPSFERISTVPLDGYSVGIYRTNCGAPCSYGIYPLQERQIIPGILLVRALPGFDEAGGATYQVIGQDTLLINVPPYVDDYHPWASIPARSQTYHLKPFLYF